MGHRHCHLSHPCEGLIIFVFSIWLSWWPLHAPAMERFSAFFPKIILVWSKIVPCLVWKGGQSEAVVRDVCKVNAHISRFVRSTSGVVVCPHQLEKNNGRFMIPESVHRMGADIFHLCYSMVWSRPWFCSVMAGALCRWWSWRFCWVLHGGRIPL